MIGKLRWLVFLGCAGMSLMILGGCASEGREASSGLQAQQPATIPDYRIGPLDTIQVFVWQAPELSVSVPVRPDGRISMPLIEDLEAAGKTPQQLSRDIEGLLANYVQEPVVSVIVTSFSGPFDQQIRVVGAAAQPRAVPYRANMSVLDALIEVGGLTEFAAGNRAVLVRGAGSSQEANRLRLDDLIRDGDISANVALMPGDIIIIPESFF